VSLAVAEAGWIRLGLYDTAGRLVRQLANGPYEPGVRLFMWDGHGDDGRAVRGGVYFVRAQLKTEAGAMRTVARRMAIVW